MNHHLAILYPVWIELILDGSKTIESRFSKVRCAPFGKVSTGDTVYLKVSGGPVKGQFTVADVTTFENLTLRELAYIDTCYGREIFVDPEFSEHRERWMQCKYATLIHIANPVRYDHPFAYPKRDPRAWVVLDAPLQNVGS